MTTVKLRTNVLHNATVDGHKYTISLSHIGITVTCKDAHARMRWTWAQIDKEMFNRDQDEGGPTE